jgi:RecB family exonuclease
VNELKRADLMAPVTVVSPSRYASLSLRQELGGKGFINVRFIQMPVLAELLGGASLAAQGKKPITSTLQSIALRQALSETGGLLHPVRLHARTQSSVRAAFRELRRLDEKELETVAASDSVTSEVVSLYRQHRQAISGRWFDHEDLASEAAVVVRKGEAAALDSLGHVVFFLPRPLSPGETALVLALASDKRCSVILGITDDDQADRLIREMQGYLAQSMREAGPVAGPAAESEIPGTIRLHVAPSAHEELRWVIRQIVAEAGENGTPFHRMAVLYRMENPYGTLISDELALSKIPLAGPSRDLLADTPAGQTLLGLLDLPVNDFRRDEVMEWLTGCPVKPAGASQANFSPSRWDAISRQAGIVGGPDQWRERLSTYARTAREQAEAGEWDGGISEARAAAMRDSADAALGLRDFVLKLVEALKPPEDGSTWTTFCQWQANLLQDYLAYPIGVVEEAERDNFVRKAERVLQLLEEVKSADSLDSKPTMEEFRQVVRDALQAPQGHLGPTGLGVFVSSFADAAGMSFDRIWLVGMIEGAVPPALRPDPLLPQGDLTGRGHLSSARRRMAEEKYNYLAAVATAPRRTLSYPITEAASRRTAYPSRWFLEQASNLAGKQVHSGDLLSLTEEPWLSATRSAEHALDGLVDGGLADLLDYQLERLVRWKNEGNSIANHPLAAGESLARAARMGRERRSRRFTQYDGNLGRAAAGSRLGRFLETQPISPTRLEAWATCPFRYFLANVLRLGALETPEDTTRITPLERGKLVHKILEDFIVQSKDAGWAPTPGNSWTEEDYQRLLQIAETEFEAAQTRGVTGKPLLWEMEKQSIRDDLGVFLTAEAKIREQFRTGEIQVEVPFGLGGSSLVVADDATGLRFRGLIDRVDISADGRAALVMDYKTGSPNPYKGLENDPIDHGKRLQLGIYSLAAQRMAPQATEVKAAYWLASGRGEFRFAPKNQFDINAPDTARRFRDGVTTVVSGIRQGVFPANPGERGQNGFINCQYCDFNALCPSRRDYVWETKKGDDAAAIYRQLAEGDSEEAGQEEE